MNGVQNCKNIEELYTSNDFNVDNDLAEWFEVLRSAGIKGYRWKTIRSGNFLEVEIYPYWKKAIEARAKRGLVTTSAQQIVNARNQIKHITRLMHENFTEDDIFLTTTYDADNLPETEEAALKNIQNYLRRLKNYIKKSNKQLEEQGQQKLEDLKYILVTETKTEDGKPTRIHHHLVMNFRDRDKAEALWKFGIYNNSRRLKANEYGFEALATYIAKQKKDTKYQKTYSTSRNLKKYKIKTSDKKITKRRATKLYREELDPREFFEKEFKNYIFTSMDGRVSDHIDGCYLHVKMREFDVIPTKKSNSNRKAKVKSRRNKSKKKEVTEKQMDLVVSYEAKGKFKSIVGMVSIPIEVDLLITDGKWYVRKLDEKLENVIVNEISVGKAKLILEKLGREDLLLKYFKNKE